MPRRGPFQVLSNEGSRYSLLNLITGKSLDRHISLLTAFDTTRCSPLDVASRDTDAYIVEKILDHRPKTKNAHRQRSKMSFKVSWIGYGPEDCTWEPTKNLTNNLLFTSTVVKTNFTHSYLFSKKPFPCRLSIRQVNFFFSIFLFILSICFLFFNRFFLF
jgi:hypothetical protein